MGILHADSHCWAFVTESSERVLGGKGRIIFGELK